MHCKNIVHLASKIEESNKKRENVNETTVHVAQTKNEQNMVVAKSDIKEVKFSFLNHGDTVPYFP